MKLKLDPKTALLTIVAVACIAATVAKRAFFSTTTVDSAAFTTLSTNLLAQSTASAARGVLNVTNATGLEATDANLIIVSNTVSGHTTFIAAGSNATASVSNNLVAVTATVAAIPAGTNIVTLNGTETITGPKTLTAALTATNPASLFAGNGAGLTNLNLAVPAGGDSGWTNLRSFYRSAQIQTRTLLNTNIPLTFFNAATNNPPPISPGGFAQCTPLFQVTLPPALGSNSIFTLTGTFYKTNGTSSSFATLLYAGTATNLVGGATNGVLTTSATVQKFPTSTLATFRNWGGYTTQFGGPGGNDIGLDAPAALVDTSVPWQAYLGATSLSGATNAGWVGFTLTETVLLP